MHIFLSVNTACIKTASKVWAEIIIERVAMLLRQPASEQSFQDVVIDHLLNFYNGLLKHIQLRFISSKRFLLSLYLMNAVLEHLNKLLQLFQKGNF